MTIVWGSREIMPKIAWKTSISETVSKHRTILCECRAISYDHCKMITWYQTLARKWPSQGIAKFCELVWNYSRIVWSVFGRDSCNFTWRRRNLIVIPSQVGIADQWEQPSSWQAHLFTGSRSCTKSWRPLLVTIHNHSSQIENIMADEQLEKHSKNGSIRLIKRQFCSAQGWICFRVMRHRKNM